MADPNTRGKVRRAHERREQSGDTEGLHMDEAIRALVPATDSNVQKTQIAPSTQKGDPGCP